MRVWESWSFSVLLIAGWAVPHPACGQTEDAVLAEIQEVIEATHKFSAGDGSLKLVDKDKFITYTMLLKKLAGTRGHDGAARTALQKELVAIARSYAADPGLTDELVRNYGRPLPTRVLARRAIPPARVRPEHATERYRLAWEGVLLAPLTAERACMEKFILDALRHVGTSESVPILVEAFRPTTAKDVPQTPTGPGGSGIPGAVFGQVDILRTLSLLDENEVVLNGMFACLSLADERYGDKPPRAVYAGGTLSHIVFLCLMHPGWAGLQEFERLHPGRTKRWQAVIDNYSNPNLSERTREFLRKLKSYRPPSEGTGDVGGKGSDSSSLLDLGKPPEGATPEPIRERPGTAGRGSGALWLAGCGVAAAVGIVGAWILVRRQAPSGG